MTGPLTGRPQVNDRDALTCDNEYVTADLRNTYPAALPDEPRRPEDVLWMLDLDPDGNPVLAHQIVATERRKTVEHTRSGEVRRWAGEVRTTACGLEVTAESHPAGWWSTKAGEFPLQQRWVHCGDGQPVAGAT